MVDPRIAAGVVYIGLLIISAVFHLIVGTFPDTAYIALFIGVGVAVFAPFIS